MVPPADYPDPPTGGTAHEWTGGSGGGRVPKGQWQLAVCDGCGLATSAGDDPALAVPSTEEWCGSGDGQPLGSRWGCQQSGVQTHADLACLCLDDALDLPAAVVQCDRSLDRVLYDPPLSLEDGRAATRWVQDPVGDLGLASAVEGGGSADPVWLSPCRGEQSLGGGDDQVLSWFIPLAAGGGAPL